VCGLAQRLPAGPREWATVTNDVGCRPPRRGMPWRGQWTPVTRHKARCALLIRECVIACCVPQLVAVHRVHRVTGIPCTAGRVRVHASMPREFSTPRGVAIVCIPCEMCVVVMAATAGLAARRWASRTRHHIVQAVGRYTASPAVGGGDQVGRRKLRWCASIAAVGSAWCSQRDSRSVAGRPRVSITKPVSPLQ
jgi:hypothetical protein